ncbi:hypothetical protein IMSHALPRED_001800 [Imshaugia aleurites]|uniref:ATP synthase mitochondrial F1 complex assembly factor 1 n=1 Tax=Imshaugia aleurites TaxID=172621 RepID=A0A8H3PH69_9LECA|nr:hypothetical protein IMSHALPRED_001800 [Imshaugia aleurites]
MSALRLGALGHACGKTSSLSLRGVQRRHAQVHDVRFLVTHRQPNKIIEEKYKDKLYQKAKEKGLKNVDELKAVYQDKIQSQRRQALAPNALNSTTSSESGFPAPPPPPKVVEQSTSTISCHATSSNKSSNPPGIKLLSSYIDIPKTLELPQKEIEYIWRLRHASDPQSLCAVIPQSIYNRIEATARRHPQFILPIPRESKGAEIHFLQWTFPSPTTSTVLFTHLAEFKLRGEYAQPHTTVTHHLDLADSKRLVLLQGNVVDGRGITVDEGKWLLMCLQKFYGAEHEVERKKLLEQFSQGDGGFKVEELLEEAEKVV